MIIRRVRLISYIFSGMAGCIQKPGYLSARVESASLMLSHTHAECKPYTEK